MLEEIKSIKQLRQQLNMTQHQFAKAAGVSQSLIAKIEAGKLDPSYTKARQIFDTLNRLNKQQEKSAKEIMTSTIYSVSKDDALKKAINLMHKHGISHLPVIDANLPVGLIGERDIIRRLSDVTDHASEIVVKDLMADAPPIVSPSTPLSLASNMLRHFPIILVANKGKLLGIITKADILKAV